jgi:hypothetical protein
VTIPLQRQAERATLIRQSYANRLEVVAASPRWPEHDITQKRTELAEIEALERTIHFVWKHEHAIKAALNGGSI